VTREQHNPWSQNSQAGGGDTGEKCIAGTEMEKICVIQEGLLVGAAKALRPEEEEGMED
jgi:hypothetical protein